MIMINRKYFFSVKVSHDNGTGMYSWYSGVANKASFFKNEEQLIGEVRQLGCDKMQGLVDRCIFADDVQIVCLSKS
jgi:hypothetical protein